MGVSLVAAHEIIIGRVGAAGAHLWDAVADPLRALGAARGVLEVQMVADGPVAVLHPVVKLLLVAMLVAYGILGSAVQLIVDYAKAPREEGLDYAPGVGVWRPPVRVWLSVFSFPDYRRIGNRWDIAELVLRAERVLVKTSSRNPSHSNAPLSQNRATGKVSRTRCDAGVGWHSREHLWEAHEQPHRDERS